MILNYYTSEYDSTKYRCVFFTQHQCDKLFFSPIYDKHGLCKLDQMQRVTCYINDESSSLSKGWKNLR
jgi:hypothetical protein